MGRVHKNKRGHKLKTLPQFSSNRFETNRTWTQHIGASILFVSGHSDSHGTTQYMADPLKEY